MRQAWKAFLILVLLAGTRAHAHVRPQLRMTDRVRSVSLSEDGKSYNVAFFRHAAYYHLPASSPALKCLLRSLNENVAVTVSGDAKSLVIRTCSRT